MRASINLLQLWRASKEDLGDCVVKAEKKKMTRVQKQTGTSLRADHTPRPKKSTGLPWIWGFMTWVPSKTSTLVWHLFLLENPLGECPNTGRQSLFRPHSSRFNLLPSCEELPGDGGARQSPKASSGPPRVHIASNMPTAPGWDPQAQSCGNGSTVCMASVKTRRLANSQVCPLHSG